MRNFKMSWQQAPITVSLILLMVVIFIGEVIISGQMSVSPPALYQLGAMFKPAVVYMGQWWRVITAGFLHVTLMHLVLNMITLYYVGRLLEQYFGSVRYFIGYIAAVGLGSLNSLAFGSANAISAGASGGIFGLFGMIFLMGLLDKQGFWLAQAKTLGLFVILSLIPVIGGSNIAISAHIGGLAGGFLLAPLLLKKGQASSKQVIVAALALVVYIGVLLTVGLSIR